MIQNTAPAPEPSPEHKERRAALVAAWQAARLATWEAEDALAAAHRREADALEACAANGYIPWGSEVPVRTGYFHNENGAAGAEPR